LSWWSVVKSSRQEAYAQFIKEFGPEVDLRFLEVENFLDDPENANLDYYLGLSNISDEIGYWVVQSNGANIRFVSDEYPEHEVFVEGMFQQEYPERYKEIVDMIYEHADDERRADRDDLMQLISKYLDVSVSIMKLLRDSIENRYGDSMLDTSIKSVLIPISSPNFVRMNPEIVIPKINPKNYSKSDIISAITELMVVRMIAGVHILRNKAVESRVNSQSDNIKSSSGFFGSLYKLYYDLLTAGNSGGRTPNIVFNEKVDNAENRLIGYLREIADEYLGVDS